ncbi:MAG: GDP-mannose 4,6-dehydratase [Sedimentisphaerales bacterium]|nr:GDP-mannose 4,6-dehydratase [Sedimentisphaerales bacterium]
MTEKVLVTGAAGFIGSYLCERLISNNHVVIGLDNFDPFYDRKTKESNIKNLLGATGFELIEGDIRDADGVRSICSGGVDVIVHLAAKAGVRPSIEDPVGYADTNINGTMVMLDAAKEFGVKKFIFASSSSVYGNNRKVPFSEDDNVDFPISPYAMTKKACELICHTYYHLYKINISCLRFFTVYGPRQRPDLAIHKFTRLIEQNKPIPVFGDGSMMRDFTYIDDIIDGVMASIEKCAGFEIYNLGESRPVRLDNLIEEIEKALGKKAIVERLPLQPGDVEKTFADVGKAKRELGYNPEIEISVGLEKFVKWFNLKN